MITPGTCIGIWGYGIVGQSAARFFLARRATIVIADKRQPSQEETAFFDEQGILFISEKQVEQLFQSCAFVLVSAGIDARSYYHTYAAKIITELDIFGTLFRGKTVGITGSIGKTTITTLLHQLLNNGGISAQTGGNIGCGLFDLVDTPAPAYTILELSSFQLEHIQLFAPDLGIITMITENHLDRHKTMDAYIAAKKKLLIHQSANQAALVPLELLPLLSPVTGKLFMFSTYKPDISTVPAGWHALFYIHENTIYRHDHDGTITALLSQHQLPSLSFIYNWIILVAAASILQFPFNKWRDTTSNLDLPAHRLAPIGTIQGVTFYNDSKSTTPTSTLAAVQSLHPTPIILLLGGLSKGVDRSTLVKQLRQYVKFICTFGAEAAALSDMCHEFAIPHHAAHSLEEATAYVCSIAQKGDAVLLSPAGSSYDLFKDYQERGTRFVNLVKEYHHAHKE